MEKGLTEMKEMTKEELIEILKDSVKMNVACISVLKAKHGMTDSDIELINLKAAFELMKETGVFEDENNA